MQQTIETRATTRLSLRFVATSLVFLWAAYQAFWNVGSANLNADEPVYITAGWAYVHGDFTFNREHPPTAKFILGFAQLLFGQGEFAGRLAVGAAALAGGVILYLWLKREIGWEGALFAAGAWMLLPHGVSSGVRIDRFALLEPFMVLFAIAAFAAAWQWFRTRSLLWLILSAVAMALSVTSKVSTLVMIPAIILLPLLAKRVRDTVIGGIVFVVVFGAAFVMLYLPMGMRSAIAYMLELQSAHNANGHLVVVAGVATPFPPWWANLLFTVDGMGIVATLALAIATIAALWKRPPLITLFLGSGVALLWMFYLFISSVALPHYYFAWVWLFCALAGVGVSALFTLSRRHKTRLVPVTVLSVVLVLSVASALWVSNEIAQERPKGIALVAGELSERGLSQGIILVAGMADWEYGPYLDGRHSTDLLDPNIVAIATKDSERFPLPPELREFLEANPSALDVIHIDDVSLYVLER